MSRSLQAIVNESFSYMKRQDVGYKGAEDLVREAYKLGRAHAEGRVPEDSYARVVAREPSTETAKERES